MLSPFIIRELPVKIREKRVLFHRHCLGVLRLINPQRTRKTVENAAKRDPQGQSHNLRLGKMLPEPAKQALRHAAASFPGKSRDAAIGGWSVASLPDQRGKLAFRLAKAAAKQKPEAMDRPED